MEMCQSCGMPMKRDAQGGGTNADGTKNGRYCSYCFKDGEFVGGETTVGEFRKLCCRKMVEGGTPKIVAWLLTRGMKRLERWNGK